ncbi:DUF4214 domain-containing protein [Novosphingobium sp.]|uniref:DUF4214 domain-containing protein n=1 Tax=Novosphingobium sp. TaxID=1874826 RepID=UPI0025E31192|nr:DUF4214 domain-containing protein [Novosphingobium sp.]
MSLFQDLPLNPYLRADSLASLCALADLDFVRCAYVTILGRQPDAAGESFYVSRLRSGADKLTILGQLRFSSEGALHDPGIAGLDRVLRRHRMANRPLIGWFIRLFSHQRGETTLERSIRSVQNELGIVSTRMTEGFLHLNHVIHEMNLQVLAVRAGSRSARQDGADLFASRSAPAPADSMTSDARSSPSDNSVGLSANGGEWRTGIARALRP